MVGGVLAAVFLWALAYAMWKYPERFRGYFYRLERIRRSDTKPTERALENRRKVHIVLDVAVGFLFLVASFTFK